MLIGAGLAVTFRAHDAHSTPAPGTTIASPADPNAPEPTRGLRPLSGAARTGALNLMTALIDAGADPNLRDAGGNYWVPLMHAVHKHQSAAVRLLLDRGALPDGPPPLSFTPLMMSVASG